VQIIYERGLRPPEKLHQPWVDRVTGQLLAAYDGLEQEIGRASLAKSRETVDQAGVTAAVAWHFTQRTLPEIVPADRYPRLADYSAAAESMPAFIAAPYGDSTFRQT
jgi:glutathione S-transferase